MKIAIVGAGNVGGTLAAKLGKQGHSIYLGARDPREEKALALAASIGANASTHSLAEAVQRAEIVLLATPWQATESVVASLRSQLHGKILIDCTNPLKTDLSGLELGHISSGGESVQSWAPQAIVYKAFNTTGFNIMADPLLEERRSAMYFCSDDQHHRHTVATIIRDVGFEPLDAGPLASARLLEPLALLWIQSAYKFGMGRDFAFGILRRN